MFLLSALLVSFVYSSLGVQFQFVNNHPGTIWVGIQGNSGKPALNNGGFVLNSKQQKTINSDDHWAGRFWGRTGCNAQTKHCQTGDCGNKLQCNGAGGAPPVSLAEITLKGAGGLDYYDISFVDGFNLPISFRPVGGQGNGGKYSCKNAQCMKNLNNNCPQELKKIVNGKTVACMSACEKFNTDQYCCRGAHNQPGTCKSQNWPKNYPKFFKDNCPDGYSYAYDDHKSTFTCKASKYVITFG